MRTANRIAHGATILVVDDEPRNLQLLGGILTAQHYEVLFAATGAAALQRVAARPPDLVLLDLFMPEMDGLELCRRLQADPAAMEVPIIFLTASNDSELAARALGAGAVDYVSKPFNATELLARVRTHVALKRTRDELRRIIAQKGELMSIVAHDLKNPISAVRFSALMLREQGLTAPDPRAELVDGILETSENMLTFLQARLERSAREARIERLEIYDVALSDVIDHVLRENLPAAHAKGIAIDVAQDARDAMVRADFGALNQVLNNLVSNAVKFSPSGSRVTLAVDAPDDEKWIRIWVSDQGPGLTPDDCEHLFEPYRRLSARPTGGESSTGLGLSIARDFVTSMQGKIGCEPEPGGGSRFWVKLPSP